MSLLTRIGHFSYTVARADYFGQPLIPPTCQSYRVYPAGCFRLTSGDDSNSDFFCFGPGFVSPIQALASPLLCSFLFLLLPPPSLALTPDPRASWVDSVIMADSEFSPKFAPFFSFVSCSLTVLIVKISRDMHRLLTHQKTGRYCGSCEYQLHATRSDHHTLTTSPKMIFGCMSTRKAGGID